MINRFDHPSRLNGPPFTTKYLSKISHIQYNSTHIYMKWHVQHSVNHLAYIYQFLVDNHNTLDMDNRGYMYLYGIYNP